MLEAKIRSIIEIELPLTYSFLLNSFNEIVIKGIVKVARPIPAITLEIMIVSIGVSTVNVLTMKKEKEVKHKLHNTIL